VTATFEQGRADIFARVKAAWDPTGYGMAWPDVPDDTLPPTSQVPWARTSLRHADGGQRGFGPDKRRYERTGVLTIQVFAPKGDGLSRCYQLAKILADGLEGQATPRGVWFRNVRVREAADSGNFSQVNVLADFTYDEVK